MYQPVINIVVCAPLMLTLVINKALSYKKNQSDLKCRQLKTSYPLISLSSSRAHVLTYRY